MKSTSILSLDKKDQRSVSRKTNQLKDKIKAGRISIREDRKEKKLKLEETRGLIYISHLPHGFYEEEMKNYFKQFGKVTNVKVCRSKKTGNSKGYGYVEFVHPDVAKIAAETMNNYVMFKKRLTAEYVPFEKRPKALFHGKQSTPESCSKQRRRDRNNRCRNKKIDEETHLKKSKLRLNKLQKRLKKINRLGINYDLKPVDVPKALENK